MLTLAAGDLAVTIDPLHGARLTSLSFRRRELLATGDDPLTSGCYPMVPWCGRVRNAAFPWHGSQRTLIATDGPHALHGLVHSANWDVVESDSSRVVLRATLGTDIWLSEASVTHSVSLEPTLVRCDLRIESRGDDFPAQVGWHPCFAAPLGVDFRFSSMYVRERDLITDGALTEPSHGPWDDCFTGALTEPALRWSDCEAVLRSDCTHWVIYDEVPGLVCVEPQSGPPNAFNHRPEVSRPPGFETVSRGRPLARWMEIAVRAIDHDTVNGR